MIWHIIRYLTTFIMPAFYKKIIGNNIGNVQIKGPVIIAMNHPNAFTDAILFTFITFPVRVRYLARGDAFKPGFISWLLLQIGIVPIFRIQDGGREGLKKNDEAYKTVNNLLKRNGKIIVFAEGLCVQERRLRPLKKGVARMVFGAYDYLNNDTLTVVPVGVNYSQPDKFRSTVFFNIGEPIAVKDYMEAYKNSPAKANNLFLHDLEPKMKGLITHINNKEYDGAVLRMETLCKRNRITDQGLNCHNLEHDYLVTKQITEKINQAEITHKETLDEFNVKSDLYLKEVRNHKLRDWLVDVRQSGPLNMGRVFTRFLIIIIGLPLYCAGLIGNYLPYKLTEKLTKKILKGNTEFYSSICICIGMVLAWCNYILWFIIVYALSPNILMPILICLLFGIGGWFSLYFYFYIVKTLGLLRAVKNPAIINELKIKRNYLLSLINKLEE
ncbi:MAG: 1-acyl-sn-glycerol-3-phosphate acyltransferase [Bacteroidetes bacterium]|nr:1-acyl-sn-glycerol-3-phosphate acyltransferase [Bacteroidota bacterium]